MENTLEVEYKISQLSPLQNSEGQRFSATSCLANQEQSAQISNQLKLQRLEVPPYKHKVWDMFETEINEKLSTLKQEVSEHDPQDVQLTTDFCIYIDEVFKLLSPNFRKLTTTLYDSEATTTKLQSKLAAVDESPLIALKKENQVLLDSIQFTIAKCAAVQRKSAADTQKQATALYSNSLSQVQKEFEGITDPTESSCLALDNALKDQTTVHNIRWKKVVSGHNQTCNEGVQRVAEGVALYQQLRKLILSKELAWSPQWASLSEYEKILQEPDQTAFKPTPNKHTN